MFIADSVKLIFLLQRYFYSDEETHSDVHFWKSNSESIHGSSYIYNIAIKRLISFLEAKMFSIVDTVASNVLIHQHFAKAV
jgi:hypothetical protein